MPRPQPASRPTAPTAGRTHFVVIGIQDDGSASIAIAIRPSATRRSRSAQRAEGRPPHSDSRGRAGPSAAPWWHLFGLQASRPCGEGHGGRSRSSPPPGSMQATRGHGRRSARSARPRWWCRRRRRAVRRRSIDVAVDLRDKRTRQSDRAPPSGALQPSSIISPEARRRRFTRTVATARASSRSRRRSASSSPWSRPRSPREHEGSISMRDRLRKLVELLQGREALLRMVSTPPPIPDRWQDVQGRHPGWRCAAVPPTGSTPHLVRHVVLSAP